MGCAAQERTAKQKTPQNTVNLQTSTVKADAEDPKDRDLKYCFRVVSRDRMYLLQARPPLLSMRIRCIIRPALGVDTHAISEGLRMTALPGRSRRILCLEQLSVGKPTQ